MTASTGPFSSTDFDLEDLVEQWIADRTLPADAIEWLRSEFNELTGIVSSGFGRGSFKPGSWTPMIAPRHFCDELELPWGSTWPEVLATLLDACLNFREGSEPLTHLQTIREYLPEEFQPKDED